MKRWIALLLLVTGCGSDPSPPKTSSAIPTGEIVLAVGAVGNGDAVSVSVAVATLQAEVLVLDGGDQLLASAPDAAAVALSGYDTNHYAALLDTQTGSVTLTLARPAAQSSAQIDLPPPFALTVPSGVTSAAAAIPLSWDASTAGDTMTLDATGPCIAPLSRTLAADTGTYALQPGDLSFHDAGCALAVSLVRSRASAPLGIAANGSSVTTAQVRTASLQVTR